MINKVKSKIKHENNKRINNSEINNFRKFQSKNLIRGILTIKENDVNKNLVLFQTEINNGIDVYLNNKKINLLKDNKKWKYNFTKEGKYWFEIVFKDDIKNLCGFFEYNFQIISIDLSNFNTSNVTDMSFMFNTCRNLREIKGINQLKTNNVISLNGMFQDCNELEHLDLSNWNTSKVSNMGYMFNKCKKLKKIKGINEFITKEVRTIRAMFKECKELEYLDLSSFDTSNVNDMSFIFSECIKLKEIKGINNFVTKKVINMCSMFRFCYELDYLDLSNFDTSNVKDMKLMFFECIKLKEIKGLDKFITNKVTNMRGMFEYCKR